MRKFLTVFSILFLLSACVSSGVIEKHYQESMEDINKINTADIELKIKMSADEFYSNKNYKQALAFYRQLNNMHPHSAEYVFMQAECERLLGNYDKAIELYDYLMKGYGAIDEKFAEGKVIALLQKGDFTSMAEFIASYYELINNSWRAMNAIAIAYSLQNMSDKAMVYYEQAMLLSGDSPKVLNNIALSIALSGNTAYSIEIFENLMQRRYAGNDALKKNIELNAALVYAISGNLTIAERLASKHLEKHELYNNMGVYAQLSNDKNLIAEFFNKALNESIVDYCVAWKNLSQSKN